MDLYKVDAENRIYAQQQRHHHPLFEADKKWYTVYIMGFFMVDKQYWYMRCVFPPSHTWNKRAKIATSLSLTLRWSHSLIKKNCFLAFLQKKHGTNADLKYLHYWHVRKHVYKNINVQWFPNERSYHTSSVLNLHSTGIFGVIPQAWKTICKAIYLPQYTASP